MTDGGAPSAADPGDGVDDDPPAVRVRGVYATALTRLFLDAGFAVVAASPPIRRRFDASFGDAGHDVAVDTTADRQGVGVTGDPDAVAAVRAELADVARDALAWPDPAPRDAVFDGRVTETLGGGAVVDLGVDGPGGAATGYLPYDAADGYVDEGDRLRVRVTDPEPPWSDDRPELATGVRVSAGLATLVRGGEGVTVAGRDDDAARELVGMTELLGLEPPAGWGLRWHRDAADADGDALEAALDRAAARAADVEAALDGGDGGTGRVAAPTAGAWVWFGRESRFALDDVRAAVTTTMPGHHRTKAASRAASAGVDLAEALCEPSGEFPFEVVADQFGPNVGDAVRIEHGKPDGRLIVLGTGEVTDRDGDTVAVRREMTAGGSYDELDARREAGDTAHTKFREGRWWYPTVYRDADGDRKGTYVNVCTPVECFPDGVRYVDLHVDVVKEADGTVRRVDDDELDAAVDAGDVPAPLAEKAREVAGAIENAL